MHFYKSTHIVVTGVEALRLKCSDLRTAFLAFDMLFWLFILIMLFQFAAHSNIPELSSFAKNTNDLFGNNSKAFMAGPAIIGITILYFIYGKKTVTWTDGLQIDGKPVLLTSYDIRQIMGGTPILYLQGERRRYIVFPVTSQHGRKFPDVKILKRENAENRKLVEKLKIKLIESGVEKRRFWFFTWDVTVSFLILILIIVIAFSMF